jgi:hypothetical protein
MLITRMPTHNESRQTGYAIAPLKSTPLSSPAFDVTACAAAADAATSPRTIQIRSGPTAWGQRVPRAGDSGQP